MVILINTITQMWLWGECEKHLRSQTLEICWPCFNSFITFLAWFFERLALRYILISDWVTEIRKKKSATCIYTCMLQLFKNSQPSASHGISNFSYYTVVMVSNRKGLKTVSQTKLMSSVNPIYRPKSVNNRRAIDEFTFFFFWQSCVLCIWR